jgi:hypothetical protein
LVPNLGPLLATIPAVLIALLQGSSYLPISNSWFAVIVLVFYVIVQNLENAFIVPRVLGDAVKVHPLIILAGVLVGAASAGVLGIFLAAPVIASLREILVYLYRKVLNLDPFDPPEPPAPKVRPRPSIKAWVAQLRQRMQPPAAEVVGVPADVREETLTTLSEAPGRAKNHPPGAGRPGTE